MSNEERKRIVCEGLQQKKDARQAAEQEAQLEQYEKDALNACHENCNRARAQRSMEETARIYREQAEARRAERAKALAKAQAQEDAAMAACRYYGVVCLMIWLLAALTHFPGWAAVALALGLAVFPAAYIFRLYYPIERKTDA